MTAFPEDFPSGRYTIPDPLAHLPEHLARQIKPFVDYFDLKHKEIDLFKSAPLELDTNARLKLEYSDGSDANLEAGTYATSAFANGKRAIMLGTALGMVAMYEVDDKVKCPEEVDASGFVAIPNYRLHVPEVLWHTDLLKLSIHGKVELNTFVDLFGYPKRDGRADHNRNNIANRLEQLAKAFPRGSRLTREQVLAAVPNLCSKTYGDYERGYNKALGHVREKLCNVLDQGRDDTAQNALMIDNAVEAAALLCDQAAEQSEVETKDCAPHEFVEKAVFRGAIAQAKKLAAGIRALKSGGARPVDEKDTEAHF